MRRLSKPITVTCATFLGAIFLMIYLMVHEQTVEGNIIIHQPIDTVWEYVGDNTSMQDWSVYFSHVVPLENGVKDGFIGSARRSFREDNGNGMYWDERVTDAVFPTYRLQIVYNTNGYGALDVVVNRALYNLEQRYVAMAPHTTQLKLQLSPRNLWARVTLNLCAWNINGIFKKNLENIKLYMEKHIVRAHPYDRDLF